MNKKQKIELVQAIVAILLPNYGTFLFYLQFHIHGAGAEISSDLSVPSWTPSFLTFKIIWTCFYCIIGFASFLVLKEITSIGNDNVSKIAKVILTILYTVHIPACWAWLPLLGAFNNIGWAVVALLVATSSTIVIIPPMWVVNKMAAVLFIPHMVWIIYLTTWTLHVNTMDGEYK